jgi:hypothetical protein
MARQSFIHNPLGWVQLRLIGGPRGVFFLATMYTAAIVLFLTLFYRLTNEEVPTTQFAGVAMMVLIFLEVTILLLGGTTIISKAVQRDFTSDMITSHRMSAMSGRSAILGYLTGSVAQVLALTLANWMICTVLSVIASPNDPNAKYLPTILFAIFACTAWLVFNFAVLVALCLRGSQFTAGLVVVLIMMTNTKATTFIPGLAILLASTTYSTMTNAAVSSAADPWLIVSLFSQLALGLIFFLAASRRMHRDDYAAFSPALGYVLLAFCALLAAVGMGHWSPPASAIKVPGSNDERFQIVASLIVLCLVAFVPVSNAARNHVDWVRRRSKDPAYLARAPQSFISAAIVTTLLVAVVLCAVAGKTFFEFLEDMQETANGRYSPGQRGGAVLLAFLIALFIAGWVYKIQRRASAAVPASGISIGPLLPVIGYLTVYWIVPVAGDLALEATVRAIDEPGRSLLFTCSPVGTWIVACGNIDAPLWSGLGVQAGLFVLLMAIASRMRR